MRAYKVILKKTVFPEFWNFIHSKLYFVKTNQLTLTNNIQEKRLRSMYNNRPCYIE